MPKQLSIPNLFLDATPRPAVTSRPPCTCIICSHHKYCSTLHDTLSHASSSKTSSACDTFFALRDKATSCPHYLPC